MTILHCLKCNKELVEYHMLLSSIEGEVVPAKSTDMCRECYVNSLRSCSQWLRWFPRSRARNKKSRPTSESMRKFLERSGVTGDILEERMEKYDTSGNAYGYNPLEDSLSFS